jgi:hypothetical protein
MKMRFLFIVVGLAASFALPIFAQEKEEVKAFPFTPIPAGPQLVQQIEAINQQFDEAFNKHDAARGVVLWPRSYPRIYYRFVSASQSNR